MKPMNQPYLSELHTRYEDWIKELLFYKDEIRTYNTRLEELVLKYTKVEVTSLIEQFQNQFILQNEVLDGLKHDIKADRKRLVKNAQANNVATDHRRIEDNEDLAYRMDRFKELYDTLKNKYIRFLAKSF
jgi:uncharacterized protein YjcR